MTTEEKGNIVSRRSFFRISGQIVLPILMLLVLPSCAVPLRRNCQTLLQHVEVHVLGLATYPVVLLVTVVVQDLAKVYVLLLVEVVVWELVCICAIIRLKNYK